MSDLSKLAEKIKRLQRLVREDFPDVSFVSAVRVTAFMKQRIFNFGLAADGNKIGTYSAFWASVRQSRGRQSAYVDLQFTGELFEAIQPGQRPEGATIEILNRANQDKASENEARFNKRIFELSESEQEEAVIGVEKEIQFRIRQIFD